MTFYYLVIGILFTGLILSLLKREQEKKKFLQREKEITKKANASETILSNVNAYFILIGKNFVVRKTNYYLLNQIPPEPETKQVGDLLRCKNALESEGCGLHKCCQICSVRATIRKAFNEKTNFKNLEAAMKMLSFEKRQIIACDVSVSGVYLNIDEEELMVLTIYDITELKRIQQQLLVEKENAVASDKLKTTFIANMSHEIRTPLNAIVGFSGLLAITDDEKEKNSYIDIINKNNEQLLQLFNDIFDLSKIESGMLDFNYSEIKINELLNELHELFRMRLRENQKISLLCELGAERLTLYSERERIVQVLKNFMNNAVKFTHNGEIRFGYQLREKEVYFYVTDTGIGIPVDQQAKIFSRFIKLDSNIPGTGIGLSLSQTIIQKLGGQIGVQSQPEKGSTFWFTLPYSA